LWIYDVFRDPPRDSAQGDGRVLFAAPSSLDPSGFYFADETGNVRAWSQGSVSPMLKLSSTPTALASSSTGLLAAASQDGVVKVWDTQSGAEQARAIVAGGVSLVSISPDATELLVIAGNGPQRYALNANVAVPVLLVHGGEFSPDAGFAIVQGQTQTVVDVKNQKTVNLPDPARQPVAFSVASSRGDRHVLAGPSSGPWGVFEFANGVVGALIHALDAPPEPNTNFRFSPDSRYVAETNSGLRVWDTHTGKLTAHLDLPAGAVPFAFTKDGTSIVLARGGKLTRLDVEKNEAVDLAAGGDPNVSGLRFSPDGETLAVATATNSQPPQARSAGDKSSQGRERGGVSLWRWPSMRLIRALNHPGGVPMLAFSADGANLATVCSDRSLYLWRIQDGQMLCAFHPGWPIYALGMTPEGPVAVVTSQGVSVAKWKFQGLLHDLCDRTGGGFTQQDWAQYVPEEKYRNMCGTQ